MNTEPKKTETRSTLLQVFATLPMRAWKFVSHNWQWKLLAIFLAVCLWAGLITRDPTLTRERVFTDVPVSIVNADTLRRNSGLVVLSGLEEENLRARLRVEVPQRSYNNVTYTNFNPRVDLTRITGVGEQTIKISTTSTTTYGTVEDVWPATVNVVVDEYVTNYRVPVSVNVIGEYPDTFYGSSISLDPSMVAVSGPKTIVDQVARICVDFDISSRTPRAGLIRTARAMRFLDADGNDVDSSMLEVTSAGVVLRTIIVEQTLYPTQTVEMSKDGLAEGEPAEGYRISNVTVSPASVTVAADGTVLNSLEELFTYDPVDVTGITDTLTKTVRIRKPLEVQHLSTDTVTVTVEVEPVVTSRTFNINRLSIRGIESGLKASVDARALTLVVTGPQLTLDALRPAKVSAYVDAAGLKAGDHVLPVQLHMEDTDMSGVSFLSTPATVTVTLTEK